MKLWNLCQTLDTAEQRREAQELQNTIALADGLALKIGVCPLRNCSPRPFADLNDQISGMKKLLNRRFGYGALPRRPLLPMSDAKADDVFSDLYLTRLLELEATLS